MPNYCCNCGVQLKKKKGNCPQCGTPFVQDRKLQIPKRKFKRHVAGKQKLLFTHRDLIKFNL